MNSRDMTKKKHPSESLTPQRIREVKKAGTYADGNGLYLVVEPSGNKHWVQRLVIQGKRHRLGLGGFPAVALKQARDNARQNKQKVRDGIDPLAEKRRESIPTFAQAAARVIELRRPTWKNKKHALQWNQSLQTYAFPAIGETPVSEVTKSQVLEALAPIWHTKAETDRRVRQRIKTVMDWAILQDYRDDNPAGDALDVVLPKTPKFKRHQAAVAYTEVGRVVQLVRDSEAWTVTKLSLEFLILTAARSGEVRLAQWSEIDRAAANWTVPAGRMKRDREHRVPLSTEALNILSSARSLSDGTGLVFPSPKSGTPLSDMTHRKLLMDLDVQAPDGCYATPHGFRSSFRDWTLEQTDAPWAVAEAALAHVVGNATEAAYARSDVFARRRSLMQDWASYLELNSLETTEALELAVGPHKEAWNNDQ